MKSQPSSPGSPAAPVPLGDHDVYEDETTLVNRLYYAVPSFDKGKFHCSFFFEENTFRKEENGELTLLVSTRGVEG